MTYTSPAGFHRHKCDDCGAVFEHANAADGQTARESISKHRCPNCGVRIFIIEYHGEFAPDFTTNREASCTGSKTPTAH